MDGIVFSGRELIFLLLAGALIYLLVLLLRLVQVGKGKLATPMMQEPGLDRSAAQATIAEPAAAEPPAAKPGGFGEHLTEHLARLETEMEIQRMRAEIEGLRAELEVLRAAQRVSPQYAEAMELAQRGLSAQAVADHLDISLAEAELVQALSRGDKNFKEGDEHGADVYAADDRIDEFANRRGG